jgi:glutamine amidotransferase
MEEVFEFLKKCGTYYLATVEGDQPRVRPFGTVDIFEGKLYIQTGKVKDVSKQLQANPKAEICAFADGKWLWDTVIESAHKKPLLGICLGMQLLFEKSFEHGEYEGIKFISGMVMPLSADIHPSLKVPHMGWNRLEIVKDDPIFKYFENGEWVYYVHSYYAKDCRDGILGISEYDVKVPGLVRSSTGLIYGMQFHPEKSGDAGLRLLKAFSEIE